LAHRFPRQIISIGGVFYPIPDCVTVGLTDADIARAHEYAEASAEALARYDRKRAT
jgi:hypothetical protein